MRHLLAEHLIRGDLRDPRLANRHLTVAEVRVSRDLKSATVFTTELGGELTQETATALQQASSYLGGWLARQMHLIRAAPAFRPRRDLRLRGAHRSAAARRTAAPRPREDDADGRRKATGRPINGWLVIDKGPDMTSTHVVSVVKRLTQAQKVGHGGTLDPLATGVLPIAMGEATKTVAYVMDERKAYEFTLRLGEARDTDDAAGAVTATSELRPTDEEIRRRWPSSSA